LIKIRELELDDIQEVKLWLNDPIFRSDFIPFDREISEASFAVLLSNSINKQGAEKFLVILNDLTLVGLLLCIKPKKFDYCEIGYYVVPNQRRKNIATKALSDLVDYVFKNYRVLRIEAGTSSLNIASQRLLEKAGFTKEGIRRKTLFRNGKWEDSYLYAFVKEEPSRLSLTKG